MIRRSSIQQHSAQSCYRLHPMKSRAPLPATPPRRASRVQRRAMRRPRRVRRPRQRVVATEPPAQIPLLRRRHPTARHLVHRAPARPSVHRIRGQIVQRRPHLPASRALIQLLLLRRSRRLQRPPQSPRTRRRIIQRAAARHRLPPQRLPTEPQPAAIRYPPPARTRSGVHRGTGAAPKRLVSVHKRHRGYTSRASRWRGDPTGSSCSAHLRRR